MSRSTVRFTPNPALKDELSRTPEFRKMVLGQGIEVRKGILAELPSGKSGGRRVQAFYRKAYADHASSTGEVVVNVGTRWRLGHLIEFGSVNNRAFAPIRKSVMKLGLRFEES